MQDEQRQQPGAAQVADERVAAPAPPGGAPPRVAAVHARGRGGVGGPPRHAVHAPS